MRQITPKNLYLSAFYFFFFGYVGVMVIYLPKVLLGASYSPFEIGIILSAMPIARFLAPFLFLKILNITKRLFYGSLAVFGASGILYFFALHSFGALILIHLAVGFSLAVLIPYIETYALENLKENYGKVRLFGSVGFIFTAIFLSDKLDGERNLFLFLIFTVMLAIFFAYILMRDEGGKEIKSGDDEEFSLLKYRYFWISALLMQVSFGGFYGFFTVYGEEHGFSLESISYLWSLGVVCEIVMLFFQGAVLRRFSLSAMFKFTLASTVLRWFLLFLFPSSLPVLAFTQLLHALSFALFHTLSLSFIHQLYQNKRLGQQFYAGISYGLGAFVGSIFAGYFYGKYLFLACAAVALMALFAFCKEKATPA